MLVMIRGFVLGYGGVELMPAYRFGSALRW